MEASLLMQFIITGKNEMKLTYSDETKKKAVNS